MKKLLLCIFVSLNSFVFTIFQKICHVCEKETSKYKCPKCLLLSCSLKCTRQHKIEHGCSGIRDRTAHINKEDMNDLTLLNDYRYYCCHRYFLDLKSKIRFLKQKQNPTYKY